MHHRVERIASSVDNINQRITRLTRMLNLGLDTEADMLRLFRLEGTDAGSPQRPQLEELRALVVMRYDMINHCVQSLGMSATRSLFVGADEAPVSEGGQPCASGPDVFHLFNAI